MVSDAVELPAYDQLSGNFRIEEGNLADVQTGEGAFQAKVLNIRNMVRFLMRKAVLTQRFTICSYFFGV